MNHTEIWNVARKLKLGNAFYEGLDTLLDKIETDSEPLNIACVSCFKFYTLKDGLLDEVDTNMSPPVINQYVWLRGDKYQVTSVHHIYRDNEVKIFCS